MFGVRIFFVQFLLTIFYWGICETTEWTHSTVLDKLGKYHLYWTVQQENITFKVEVATKGWVGFGLSPNGGMARSDIVIGWLKDGKPYFHDRYAEGNSMPTIDNEQNWELISISENDTNTILEFRRKLLSCDLYDRIIDNNTARVIYAFGEEDPESPNNVQYHYGNRGKRSLNLLLQPKRNSALLPENTKNWDLLSNFTLPTGRHTIYWCKMHKSPKLSKPHHIIRAVPIIQDGNEGYVHHMVLYHCHLTSEEADPQISSPGYECYHPNMPDSFRKCAEVVIAWGIGGEPLILPEYAGLLIGETGRDDYYLLEMHYDNPAYKEGINDMSGLRMYYTDQLREYRAASLMMGASVYTTVVIPPGQKEFAIAAHATPDVLSLDMEEGGIKIIAVFLHAHLLGRKLVLRHFRGNMELPPIGEDLNYDFNYQEYQYLPNERTVLPGDQLTMECTYDSTGVNVTTFGGLTTREEMCLAFVLYYPRMILSQVYSSPSRYLIAGLIGISEIKGQEITAPSSIAGQNYLEYLTTYNWSRSHITTIQDAMRYSPHRSHYHFNGSTHLLPTAVTYPDGLLHPYKRPDVCPKPSESLPQKDKQCSGSKGFTITAKFTHAVLLPITILFLKDMFQQ